MKILFLSSLYSKALQKLFWFLFSILLLRRYSRLMVFPLLLMLLASIASFGQVSGKVYRDFNANGVFDSTATTKEIGLSGITVTAYNAAGTSVGTVTINSMGAGTFTSKTGNGGENINGLLAFLLFTFFLGAIGGLFAQQSDKVFKGNLSQKLKLQRLLLLTFFAGGLYLMPNVATAQCSITLKPTVSGCYQSGGGSKTTVSIEVGWQNAPPSSPISVTFGGQTRTIAFRYIPL